MKILHKEMIYDTKTSTKIARLKGDYWIEVLFKTPGGRFFFVDRRKPNRLEQWLGRKGGEKRILPIDNDTARGFMFRAGIDPIEHGLPPLEEA